MNIITSFKHLRKQEKKETTSNSQDDLEAKKLRI